MSSLQDRRNSPRRRIVEPVPLWVAYLIAWTCGALTIVIMATVARAAL